MFMTPHLPRGLLTPKVGSVSEASVPGAPCQHTEQPMLDEVHLPAHGALTHHQIPRLEDLKAELGEYCGDEAGVSMSKQRHVGHQAPAGEVNNLLDIGGAYQTGSAPCWKMPPPSSSVSRKPIHLSRSVNGWRCCNLCGDLPENLLSRLSTMASYSPFLIAFAPIRPCSESHLPSKACPPSHRSI